MTTKDVDAPATAEEDRKLEAFSALPSRTVADEVTAVLVDAIRGGLYTIGERLPRERDLAGRLGVSRTAVHDAVRTLRRAGMVTVRRGNNGGIFVESYAPAYDVLRGLTSTLSASVEAWCETRRPLELTAANLAAQRATAKQRDGLLRLVEELEAAVDDLQTSLPLDSRFHLAIAEAAANPPMLEFVQIVTREMIAIRSRYPLGYVNLRTAAANQRDTYDAIVEGDPEWIRRSIDEHVGAFEQIMLGRRLSFW